MTMLCLCCRSAAVRVLVDFGTQPPSNRFERLDIRNGDTHPLIVGQCDACGLVQLVEPMAPAMVRSHFDWLTYNEPEEHLDDLVGRLRARPGLNFDVRILGLTYKDDTLLARFNRLGLANTHRYDMSADFGLDDKCAGLESVQAAVTPQRAADLAARHGRADLLLVRHVLEHAHDPIVFLRSLRRIVHPGGYLLFEIPDCTKFIDACDYTFVWEEHITYLCAGTLARLLGEAGLATHDILVYPYPLEDSLIGVVRNEDAPAAPSLEAALPAPPDSGTFGRRYPQVRAFLQQRLAGWKKDGKRVALFGAGHLAATFVNLYGLADMIDCVVDDNPNKQGLFMPGSRLPICGSAVLNEIDICLLALSPESQRRVEEKYRPYRDRGGSFMSIFALNPESVYEASAA